MGGLEEELRNEGIDVLGGTVCAVLASPSAVAESAQDPADNTLESFSLAEFTKDPNVGAVVCGLDTKVNYTKLSKAYQYLQDDQNCLFIATNEDSTYPSSHGLLPGAGAITAPLRTASGRVPVCTGKPASTMLDAIKAKCVLTVQLLPAIFVLRRDPRSNPTPPHFCSAELTLIPRGPSWLATG